MTEEKSLDRRQLAGNRYQRAREAMELSRARLADILGVSPQAIALRETGKREIRSEHWLAIQMVSMRVMLRRSDNLREESDAKTKAMIFKATNPND